MYNVRGGCRCGNIGLELSLSQVPSAYAPRACDCDFCRSHAAAYVSDPKGSLTLTLRDPSQTARCRQGSGTAEFLVCTQCGVLAAVLYESAGRSYAAVNSKTVNGGLDFGAAQAVSSKRLSPQEKQQRWRELWFRQVRLQGESSRG